MEAGEKNRHIDINIGKLCNNACLFCANGAIPPQEKPWVPEEVALGEIERAAASGFRSVGFLGGEITVYPAALKLVERARSLGFTRIALCTNGRRLASQGLLDKFLDAGVTRVALSIHSHREEIEDRLCGRRGAFRQKMAAIGNLVDSARRLRDGFSLNSCVHGLNVDSLKEMVCFFRERGVLDIRFNFLRPENQALGNRELVPAFTRFVASAEKLIRLNESRLSQTITFGDVPLCLWPAWLIEQAQLARKYIGELHDWDAHVTVFRLKRDVQEPQPPDRFRWKERRSNELKTHPDACRECPALFLCEGPWTRYCEIYGSEEFHPLRPDQLPLATAAVPPRGRSTESGRVRLQVAISRLCNNRCRFCLENREARAGTDLSDQLRALELCPSRDEVVFTCGEPTLHRDLAGRIRRAAELGYREIELVSNGRRLAYLKLAEELVAAGLTAVTVSVHSHLPATHDSLTRSRGSFAQTISGIKNLLSLRKRLGRPRVSTCTVLTRPNLPEMAQTVDFFSKLGVDRLKLAFVAPENEALRNFDEMVPRMGEVAQVLESIPLRRGVELEIEGLPPCLLSERNAGSDRSGAVYVYEQGRLKRQGGARRWKKGPPCRNCKARSGCRGVWVEYVRRFGWNEFHPRT